VPEDVTLRRLDIDGIVITRNTQTEVENDPGELESEPEQEDVAESQAITCTPRGNQPARGDQRLRDGPNG
jgi:hypothetical protein